MVAGYMYEGSGYEETQKYLNKFYDGLTIDQDLSSRENVVIRNEGTDDAIVSIAGTTGVGDAIKT